MTFKTSFLLALAAAAAVPWLARRAASAMARRGEALAPALRDTAFGRVEGVEDAASGTLAWKGVPYAEPPVGALRWRAPIDPRPWSGVRPAREFGPAAAQFGRLYGPGANNRYDETIGATIDQAVGSEDCLYLNVWRPAGGATKLPVIVFLHGGSNVSGYTADPMYDGAALAAKAGAVVVTVGYRLGIFGWLNMPQLKTGRSGLDDSGNYATLDTLKALQWVNRNIAAFGGDAGNVTLMGESAGAINVYALMVSPLVVNSRPQLFHRVIALSGGLSLPADLPPGSLPLMNPLPVSLAQGQALLAQLLVAEGRAADAETARAEAAAWAPTQVADYLRAQTPARLFEVLLGRLAPLGLAGSGPIPEGTVVPFDAIAAIRAGRYLKVPVLAGNTRDEGKLFPTFLALSPLFGGRSGRLVSDATLFSTQFHYRPDAPPAVTLEQWIPAQYLPVDAPRSGFNARTELLNAKFFIVNRDSMLAALDERQRGRIWYCRFDWDEEPAPWNDIYGAAHLFDVPFFFGNFGPALFTNVMCSEANRDGRLALSDAMMRSVGAFARKGDPNDASLGVAWPAWPATLLFDASKTRKRISVR